MSISDIRNLLSSSSFQRRLLRFAVVGSLGAMTYLAIGWLLSERLLWTPIAAGSVAFITVVIQNYVLHYYWTFTANSSHGGTGSRFVVATLVGLAINALVIDQLTRNFGLPMLYSQVGAMICVIGSNFIFYALWVFKKS